MRPRCGTRAPAAVIFYTDPKNVPVAAHGIALVDTIKDQPAGVLGYHTEDPGGKLWGRGRGQAGTRQWRQGDDGGLVNRPGESGDFLV
jgi:hypothetical protein